MTNTNTKEFMAKVQDTIVNDFEWTQERILNQFKVFTNLYGNYAKAKELVTGGCFDCYYSQVANTMAKWFNTTTDGIWAYYKDNEQKLWENYVHIMAKNIVCIAEGKRSYIK